MYIKQFRSAQVRVPDPLRPGKRTFEERLIECGGTQISHEGKTYDSDDGWFDVPHEVGQFFLRFRCPNGERFYTPDQVGEQVRLGALEADPGDALPKVRTGRKHATVEPA